MPLSGAVAAVYRQTTAAGTAFNDEAMTNTDGTYQRYQITNATYGYWDKTQPVTVKVDGVVQASGYTVEHLSGFVVFSPALTAADNVTVSGTALTVAQAGGMFQWKLDAESDMEDTTTYAGGGWKEYTPTLNGFSGSCAAYWSNTDDSTWLTGDEDVIVVFYTDNGPSKERLEAWAQFKKQSVDSDVKSVVKDSVDFTGDGQLYYREG